MSIQLGKDSRSRGLGSPEPEGGSWAEGQRALGWESVILGSGPFLWASTVARDVLPTPNLVPFSVTPVNTCLGVCLPARLGVSGEQDRLALWAFTWWALSEQGMTWSPYVLGHTAFLLRPPLSPFKVLQPLVRHEAGQVALNAETDLLQGVKWVTLGEGPGARPAAAGPATVLP